MTHKFSRDSISVGDSLRCDRCHLWVGYQDQRVEKCSANLPTATAIEYGVSIMGELGNQKRIELLEKDAVKQSGRLDKLENTDWMFSDAVREQIVARLDNLEQRMVAVTEHYAKLGTDLAQLRTSLRLDTQQRLDLARRVTELEVTLPGWNRNP